MMDVHTSLAGRCRDTGHLVGHRVVGTNIHWTVDVFCTIDSHDLYICYICYYYVPMLLLSDGGPLNKERDLRMLYIVHNPTRLSIISKLLLGYRKNNRARVAPNPTLDE